MQCDFMRQCSAGAQQHAPPQLPAVEVVQPNALEEQQKGE